MRATAWGYSSIFFRAPRIPTAWGYSSVFFRTALPSSWSPRGPTVSTDVSPLHRDLPASSARGPIPRPQRSLTPPPGAHGKSQSCPHPFVSGSRAAHPRSHSYEIPIPGDVFPSRNHMRRVAGQRQRRIAHSLHATQPTVPHSAHQSGAVRLKEWPHAGPDHVGRRCCVLRPGGRLCARLRAAVGGGLP